jgi:non-specific serine/threonine protein kinase
MVGTGVDLDSFTTFGELLRYLRQRARMSQRQLGIAVGYSDAQINRLEGGKRPPDLAAVRARFLEALDLQHQPELSRRLIQLAEQAQGDRPRPGPPQDGAQSVSPTASTVTPTNLPTQLTHFIGREQDVAKVRHLLAANRLVTLTGAGGCGKTRLALEVAPKVLADYSDGVWLTELAPLADPALVPNTVAAALGFTLSGERAREVLTEYLRGKHLLLVLDNCEHLIGACAELVEALLRACPHLRVLATSREALRVPGEVIWRVPSLAAAESARLFTERAQSAAPGLTLTDRNTPLVAKVCERLDGIPLAIELAAARIRSLPVEQIAARLDDRFRLLTGGARPALPRQQTLRGSIDWSYDLLSEPERLLLGRLAAFAGGWALEAAEAVGAGAGVEPGDVLDLLTRLVDKSLVAVQEGEGGEVTRYGLHETIRQYAAEKLAERGEAAEARRRHARFYLGFVQANAPPVMRRTGSPVQIPFGAGVVPWLRRLDPERGNLRAALAWGLREAHEPRDVDAGIQLALWLSELWRVHGPRSEGGAWLERALAHVPARTQTRTQLLLALADFVLHTGDAARAEALAREAVAICQERGDRYGLMVTLFRLTSVIGVGRPAEYRALVEEWLSVARDLGDTRYAGMALYWLAQGVGDSDAAQAAALYDESLRTLPQGEEGDRMAVRFFQGSLMWRHGEPERGMAQAQEALAFFRWAGGEHRVAFALRGLGGMALSQGDAAQAGRHYREALTHSYRHGSKIDIGSCLGPLAAVAALEGQPVRAVTLWSAAVAFDASVAASDDLWATTVRINTSVAASDDRERVDAARGQLDAREAAAAEAAGRAMTLDQAVQYALQYGEADEPPTQSRSE